MSPQSLTIGPAKLVGEHILSEANGYRSREHVILAPTVAALSPGTVLGRILTGARTVVAAVNGANTGNGVFAAAPTADAGAPSGTYTVEITAAAANAGAFRVERPDGTLDGVGQVGVAYNGTVNFTLQDGAVDFVVGDRGTVTVTDAAGSQLYVPLNPAAADGSQNFAGILFGRAPINAGNQRQVAHVRDAEINEKKITLVNALNAGQMTTLRDQARAVGIVFNSDIR